MRKNLKKSLSLLMTTTLAASMLIGCGSPDKEEKTEKSEPKVSAEDTDWEGGVRGSEREINLYAFGRRL